MTKYRTEQAVRRYDIFKGTVTGLLLLALLILAASGEGGDTTASLPAAGIPAAGGAPAAEVAPPAADLAGGAAGIALTAPDLLSPAPGTELNAGPITFSGMGVPGSQVAVVAAGQELGRTVVDGSGTWQLQVELPTGDVDIELRALDTGGNVAASSPVIPMTIVDAAAGLEPLVIGPLPQDAVAGLVTISGRGEPGYQAAVDVNGVQAVVTGIDESGAWSADVPMVEGTAEIAARMLGPDGAVVRSSSAGQLVVAAGPPPTVDLPASDVFEGQVTLTGTGRPDETLRLLANGADIGKVVVGEDGTWTLVTILPADDYEIDVASLDDQGNMVAIVPGISLPVLALEAPVVQPPALALPDFNPLTGLLFWQGQSDPGSRVAALVDGEVAGETTAGNEGNWTLNLDLEPGQYSLSFAHLDESGNVLAQSEPTAVTVEGRPPQVSLPEFALPDQLPAAGLPEIKLPAGSQEWTGTAEPGSAVAVIVDGVVVPPPTADEAGNFTLPFELSSGATAIQLGILGSDGNLVAQSEALPAAVADTVVPTLQLPEISGEESTVTVSGTAAPGTVVQITGDGETLGEALADAAGAWSLELQRLAGALVLRARALDEAGNVVLSSTPALLPGIAEAATAETAVVSGTVTYREPVALPDDAVITVQIQDVTVADAPVKIIGEQLIESGGLQVPIPYEVPYNPDEIQENLTYSMAARIADAAGELLFISDTFTPVITGDNPTEEVEIVTVQVVRDEEDIVEEAPPVDLEADADTVVEATLDAGSFSVLLDGLEMAGLTTALSDVEGAYTLFAPTDAAFAAIPPGIIAGWNANPDAYVNIMRYLVVEGSYAPEELTDGTVLQTLAGTNIGIRRDGEQLLVNGVPVLDAAAAGSSTVYALSEVILPPLAEGVNPPIIDEYGVPTFTGPLLTVVGTAEPGTRILVTVDGERHGDIATVQEDGFWLVKEEIGSGVYDIVAYMLDDAGLLMAISPHVELPVP